MIGEGVQTMLFRSSNPKDKLPECVLNHAGVIEFGAISD